MQEYKRWKHPGNLEVFIRFFMPLSSRECKLKINLFDVISSKQKKDSMRVCPDSIKLRNIIVLLMELNDLYIHR